MRAFFAVVSKQKMSLKATILWLLAITIGFTHAYDCSNDASPYNYSCVSEGLLFLSSPPSCIHLFSYSYSYFVCNLRLYSCKPTRPINWSGNDLGIFIALSISIIVYCVSYWVVFKAYREFKANQMGMPALGGFNN